MLANLRFAALAAAVLFGGDLLALPGHAQSVSAALASGGSVAAGQAPERIAVTGELVSDGSGKAKLYVRAKIASGWHIYSISQPPGGPVRTEIAVEPSPAYRQLGEFRALTPPEAKIEELFGGIMVESHHDEAVWVADIELADGNDAQTPIAGRLRAQLCDPTSCLSPENYPFTAVRVAAPPPVGGGAEVASEAAPAVAPFDLGALVAKLAAGFLGGIILNLMPCVLPVISLKIFSFVEQAGESRGRVLELNIWYSLGLMSVFMLLAVLAVTMGMAWGQQFTLPWFKVGLTALVFAMALSFLGVWEIPIPGFVGTGRAGELQVREGASGAFFKGVFTTILATPCSGPLLGGVFGYLLTQPPAITYLVFASVGLGMASPYLVIGAYPELIRFLPRPGAWMDTLKQLMGFLLLGTVVYLFSTLSEPYFIPTLTLLVGLWFACWLIGRTPLTAELTQKATAWAAGIASAALVGWVAFAVMMREPGIVWQEFSPRALNEARAAGKTVMVDFTADWCPTCLTNLVVAIDRPGVRRVIEANGVVPMIADWTDGSPTVKAALNELGRNSIPVLAVWPARPEQAAPIVLTDLLVEGQVIEALEKAGPSVSASGGPIAMRQPR